ncbi:multiple epidermal growth factor-like domains protein 9 [Narcine bancroftii]|uniref:multiple epidermal growth factor-like domains protein 9 n=1 Tax=Narcine bancroftii TaxID=1343680 RepID=UPI00383153EB
MRLHRADCRQWRQAAEREPAWQPGTMRPPGGRLALILLCLAWPGLGHAGWNGTEGYGNASSPLDSGTSGQLRSTANPLATSSSSSGAPSSGWADEPWQEFKCNCSIIGSINETICNASSGQCDCLPGYTGLQCSDCAEGFYYNTTNGQCIPCDCNDKGAANSQCDSTGTCRCRQGVTGLKCSWCQELHYDLSEAGCKPCQCNNLSLACDHKTGICLNCTGNTEGPNCGMCKESFYRKPQAESTAVCERCPCSVVTSSGSCHIELTEPVCDQCQQGYIGSHCDECADGYYNSDSICVHCECNGNIDPESKLPICDSESGQCLSCTSNTTGFHCHKCAEGYSGDALSRTCQIEVTTALPATSTELSTSSTPTVTSATTSGESTSDQTLLSTVLSTSQNRVSTATPVAPEISWTRFNIVVLVVIIAVVVLLMGFVAAVYIYREYQNRKLNAPFWTIELKEDNISFSSYHDSIPNADVSGLLEDDGNEVVPNGQLTLSAPMNSYKI